MYLLLAFSAISSNELIKKKKRERDNWVKCFEGTLVRINNAEIVISLDLVYEIDGRYVFFS